MYKAFRIIVDEKFDNLLSNISNINLNNSVNIKAKLSAMIKSSSLDKSNSISANSIWDEWFPAVKADVFISHSSQDSTIANKFSSWLKENVKLNSFIDSEVWGHSKELLKEIDEAYCLNPHDSKTYSYEKRNESTAHVHMILSYALTRMIDKTECFIFLESKNSVTAKETIEGTYSPWIFHELAMADTIDLKLPERLNTKTANFTRSKLDEAKGLNVKYPILGRRLVNIGARELGEWKNKINLQEHSLDILSKMVTN